MEPVYQGEPILAVAAVDELTAADAIEKIRIDYEPLPFRGGSARYPAAGGPDPRTDGNIWTTPGQARPTPSVVKLKWTESDFEEANHGRLPMGKVPGRMVVWRSGCGLPEYAALVLDETFVTPDTSHQTLEPRSAMAYWQNGKVYIHSGTQSTAQTRPAIARWLNLDIDKVVFISEYTGGGFGSKITGGVSMIVPALLSKKTNAPVMMRISREEETYIGRARPGFQGRMKVGFSKERPHPRSRYVRDFRQRSLRRAGRCADVGDEWFRCCTNLQRCAGAGLTVLTNTPPRSAQSSPGGMQGNLDYRTDHREGGAEAGGRPGGDPLPQLSGGEGAIWATGKRTASACHQRLSQGSFAARRGEIQVAGKGGARSEANWHEGARCGGIVELLRRRHGGVRRAARHHPRGARALPVRHRGIWGRNR
ncbi:MAG: xanthine dehydrogenase family protein [Ignavibacteriota bacterium]